MSRRRAQQQRVFKVNFKRDHMLIEGGLTIYGLSPTVKTCGKAENDEAKSGNDEAKGVPGRRGLTEGDGR